MSDALGWQKTRGYEIPVGTFVKTRRYPYPCCEGTGSGGYGYGFGPGYPRVTRDHH